MRAQPGLSILPPPPQTPAPVPVLYAISGKLASLILLSELAVWGLDLPEFVHPEVAAANWRADGCNS